MSKKVEKLYKGKTFNDLMESEGFELPNRKYQIKEKRKAWTARQKLFEKLLKSKNISAIFRGPDYSLKIIFKDGSIFKCKGLLVKVTDNVIP